MKYVNSKGFTLVELLVTLAVAGVILAFAAPSVKSIFQSSRMASSNNAIVGAIRLARTEAMNNQKVVTIANNSSSGQWEKGWKIYVSEATSGTRAYTGGSDRMLRQVSELPPGITLRSLKNTKTYISFNADGSRLIPAPGSDAIMALCDARGSSYGVQITISRIGRVSTKKLEGGSCGL